MSPTVRRIVAVITALITAVSLVMLFDWVSHLAFPYPAGIDYTNRESIEGALRDGLIPVGGLVIVAVGWVVAAAVGATVALKVSREGNRGATMFFTALFTAATVTNLVMLPHPVWLWFVGAVAVPLTAILAGRDRSAG